MVLLISIMLCKQIYRKTIVLYFITWWSLMVVKRMVGIWKGPRGTNRLWNKKNITITFLVAKKKKKSFYLFTPIDGERTIQEIITYQYCTCNYNISIMPHICMYNISSLITMNSITLIPKKKRGMNCGLS